uniref:(California timema) hypothetical protein n=1 Tax=Timema californicum TaxID=61474 RepID=A0A7R9P3W6_TIMCA|nr:unnamed protein product [Timema californicum]
MAHRNNANTSNVETMLPCASRKLPVYCDTKDKANHKPELKQASAMELSLFLEIKGHFSPQFKFSNEQIEPGAVIIANTADGRVQYIRPENGASILATGTSGNVVQGIPVTLSAVPVSMTTGNAFEPAQNQHPCVTDAIINTPNGTFKYHAPSGTFVPWSEIPIMHHFNDGGKHMATLNVPYSGQAVNSATAILAVQRPQTSVTPTLTPSVWPVRFVPNIPTVTVNSYEKMAHNYSKSVGGDKVDVSKQHGKKEKESCESEEDSDDTSKSDLEVPISTDDADASQIEEQKNSFNSSTSLHITENGVFHCHKSYLQDREINVPDYMSRLSTPGLPLSIQHFLKYQADTSEAFMKTEIEANFNGLAANGTEGSVLTTGRNIEDNINHVSKRKKKRPSKRKPRPGEIRILSALDGSPLFCCPECDVAYPDKDLLEQHMTGHKLERRFICNICGAALKRKEHLDQHKKGHSDERPFVCSVCLKGFKRNEHLTRHYAIHSGSKNFSCLECEKAFSRKDHLRKHSQTHIAKREKTEIKQITSEQNVSQSMLTFQQNTKIARVDSAWHPNTPFLLEAKRRLPLPSEYTHFKAGNPLQPPTPPSSGPIGTVQLCSEPIMTGQNITIPSNSSTHHGYQGTEKMTWLQSIIPNDSDKYNFCELGKLGCPSLSKLKKLYEVDKCSTHSGTIYSCATENVRLLNEWFKSDQTRFLREDV